MLQLNMGMNIKYQCTNIAKNTQITIPNQND